MKLSLANIVNLQNTVKIKLRALLRRIPLQLAWNAIDKQDILV